MARGMAVLLIELQSRRPVHVVPCRFQVDAVAVGAMPPRFVYAMRQGGGCLGQPDHGDRFGQIQQLLRQRIVRHPHARWTYRYMFAENLADKEKSTFTVAPACKSAEFV